MYKFWSSTLAVLLAFIAGCALAPTDAEPDVVALPYVRSFSGHPEGDTLPQGWQPWILSRFKRLTEYRLVNERGRTVVRARAQNSASGCTRTTSTRSASRSIRPSPCGRRSATARTSSSSASSK